MSSVRVERLADGTVRTYHLHPQFDISYRGIAWEAILTSQLKTGMIFPFFFFLFYFSEKRVAPTFPQCRTLLQEKWTVFERVRVEGKQQPQPGTELEKRGAGGDESELANRIRHPSLLAVAAEPL